MSNYTIPGVPDKAERWIFSTLRAETYLFTSLNQTSSAEENDTKIIKFDLVILILWPFVKTQVQNLR